ncbi:MAG: GntR family transcriptional regulator [Kangiellaceae bacterium]|nr:GntR family transcriptional regulator [Kangiellaceae bacterium]
MNLKITDNIKEGLLFQLSNNVELPFELTLNAIATHYAVSITPVRQVLLELVNEGFLTRKKNGRIERKTIPATAQTTNFQKSTKPNIDSNLRLENEVIHYVVQLSLKNHTDYLREEATAKLFSIGRTIMRQILSRLEGAGFVKHVARCGWLVTQLREKDVSDYLEIREILELKAMKLSQPYFDSNELTRLLNENITSDDPLLLSLNNDLHNYWINRCDNKYIQDFFNRHGNFYSAVFDYVSLEEKVMREMAQEHRDILEALINQDHPKAEKALIKHIRDQKLNLMNHAAFKKLHENS